MTVQSLGFMIFCGCAHGVSIAAYVASFWEFQQLWHPFQQRSFEVLALQAFAVFGRMPYSATLTEYVERHAAYRTKQPIEPSLHRIFRDTMYPTEELIQPLRNACSNSVDPSIMHMQCYRPYRSTFGGCTCTEMPGHLSVLLRDELLFAPLLLVPVPTVGLVDAWFTQRCKTPGSNCRCKQLH